VPTAERRGDRIVVPDTRWSEKDIVSAIAGARWDEKNKTWTLPLSWASCLQLRAGFGQALINGPELAAWAWAEFNGRIKPALALRDQLTRVSGAGYDYQLYDFQTAGAEFLTAASWTQPEGPAGGAILADDMGLGKTAQIYAVLRRLAHLLDEGIQNVLPAVVFCPNSVKKGWRDQAIKWDSKAHVYVVSGSAAQRRKILAEAAKDPLALVIVNIEAARLLSRLAPYGSTRLARCRQCDKKHGEETLSAARCEVHRKELNGFGFRTVVLDEAHRTKDPTSKQTRAIWAVAHDPSVRRRWAMTGTPIADNIGDLWSILHFIAPHEHPSKVQYIERYALRAWNPYGGLDIVGVNPEHHEEFFKILDARFRRVPKALVLDQLPQVIRSVRWVEMATKQAKAYREMEDRLMTRLDDGSLLVAPNNLVNAARLLQLSSSYCEVEMVANFPVKDTDKCSCRRDALAEHREECPNRWKMIVTPTEPSPKLDAMEEAFDELGGKQVVICAMHRKLIDLAAKRFDKRKIPYSLIVGGMSDYERHTAIEQFKNGTHQVALLTIEAGGTGLDGLQVADTLFCLQRSWSMINNVQMDGRVHRIGSEVHDFVHIVEFVTDNSIESDKQYPRLAAKYQRLSEITRDRIRLMHAGLAQNEMYELNRQESRAMTADLTEDPEPLGDTFEESLRETAEKYGITSVLLEEEEL
jgi:SNF2 family DNA or RNA helicase